MGRLRDIYSLQEAKNAQDRERVGREEAALRSVQAADRDREKILKEMRRKAKAVEQKRQRLVAQVFGCSGLFGQQRSGEFQQFAVEAPKTLMVPGLGEGLFGGRCEEVWSSGGVRHPGYAGMRNPDGNASFVSSVAQVLLRSASRVSSSHST